MNDRQEQKQTWIIKAIWAAIVVVVLWGCSGCRTVHATGGFFKAVGGDLQECVANDVEQNDEGGYTQ